MAVRPNDTIGAVKAKIHEKEGVDLDQHSLTYDNKKLLLDDHLTLADNNIRAGTILHLSPHIRSHRQEKATAKTQAESFLEFVALSVASSDNEVTKLPQEYRPDQLHPESIDDAMDWLQKHDTDWIEDPNLDPTTSPKGDPIDPTLVAKRLRDSCIREDQENKEVLLSIQQLRRRELPKRTANRRFC